VEQLIASADPAVFICNGCVGAAEPAARSHGTQSASPKTTGRDCSFCRRPLGVLSKAHGTICAECLDLCREILAEARRE